MREDIDKVVHEAHKRGTDHFKPYRRLKKFNPKVGGEDVGGREGMTKRYGWDGKSSSLSFASVDGAIRKAVGKPWDKFYSELSKIVDHRSSTGKHIFDHLEWSVERNLYVEDGELYIKNNYRNEPLKGSSTEFYVDPRDGILKFNKQRVTYRQANARRDVERKVAEAKVYRKIDANTCLRLIDGVWYQYDMKDVPKAEFEYVKPNPSYGKDANGRFMTVQPAFRIGYALLGRGIIEKKWEELNGAERARYGVRVAKYGVVRDIFNGETYPHAYRNPAKYHATKKTASQKMLRKAGLLK